MANRWPQSRRWGCPPVPSSRSNRRFRLWLTSHHNPQAHSTDPAMAEVPMSEAFKPTTPSPSARPKTNGCSGVTRNSSPRISTVAAEDTPNSSSLVPETRGPSTTALSAQFVTARGKSPPIDLTDSGSRLRE
jgi:hypothetical protein